VSTTEELRAADDIGGQLVRLVRLIERVQSRRQVEHPDAVDPTTYLLLAHLVQDGPCRSGALAGAVHSDPSTVSRQAAQLVRLGLAERVADPADGRATLLIATDEGRRVFAENRQMRTRRVAGLLADWTTSDRHLFARLLTRFTDAVERHKLRPERSEIDKPGVPHEPVGRAHAQA
jgi:DNA-binding MarR family transcriptional regulator